MRLGLRYTNIKVLIRDVFQNRLYGRHTYFRHAYISIRMRKINEKLKALDTLKHIFQSDVIIIDNESSLFIWETYHEMNVQVLRCMYGAYARYKYNANLI